METLAIFLTQFLLEAPGVLIIWLFSDKKKSFFKIQEEERFYLPSIAISLLIYGITAVYFIFYK